MKFVNALREEKMMREIWEREVSNGISATTIDMYLYMYILFTHLMDLLYLMT